MKQLNNVLDCYAKTATLYADVFGDELAHKPLDRLLLTRFADENRGRGAIIDLGCGPGQTTAYLHQAGLTDLLGTDLSPAMIATARRRNVPTIRFEVADMLQLSYPVASFGAAVSFYSIVHLTMYEVVLALEEMNRVLKPGGQVLLAFHAMDEPGEQQLIHRTDFLEQPVDVNFYLFDVDEVLSLAAEAGLQRTDALVRYPYATEYPTKRAYLLLTKS